MKRTLSAGLAVLVLAACSDGGTGPGTSIVSVTVSPSQRTLTVGETVQLSATILDSDGGSPANAQVNWQSNNQAVASVTLSGLVTGVAAGTAKVIASYGGKADTTDITVQAAPSGGCTDANTTTLAVGATQTFSSTQAAQICLPGGASGTAEYTLIPHYASPSGDASTSFTVTPGGTTGVSGPPSPSLAPAPRFALQFTPGAELSRQVADPGKSYHVRLREQSREALSALVPGAQQWYRNQRAIRRQVSGAVPAVGDQFQYNVSQSFCTPTDYRTGRVEAVGQRAIVVADVANPANGLTTADYEHIAATFDTLVYPNVVAAFGDPQDIDNNGRSVIFYTRAVNELTPADQDFIVGGFFYGRDLFPKQAGNGFPACGGSNVAEMFYMLAADPTGAVNGHVRSRNYIMENTIATVAHEFQHLISASRRLYVVGATGTAWSEDSWLNEGLSHIAEELLFYHRTGLTPRQNVDLAAIQQTNARVAAANEFMLQNFGRYLEFIEAPQTNSVYQDDDDLATRGAAWAFLRYAADRRNGNDAALWTQLVNTTLVGLPNLQAAIGTEPTAWVRDWTVSVYADDAVTAAPAAFQQPSWNFRSILPAITTGGGFKLLTRNLTAGTPLTTTLVGGAAAYLRAGVASGGRGSFQFTSGGAALPATVTVTVLRTK